MKFVVLLVFVLLTSCARAPLKNPEDAMRPIEETELKLQDSLALETLKDAFRKNLQALKKPATTIMDPLRFGTRFISKMDYILALEAAEKQLTSFEQFVSFLQNHFEAYEVYGDEHWGDVFATGYFEPYMKGSHKRTKEFTEPLYKIPPDMVTIDLKAFAERNPEFGNFLATQLEEQKIRSTNWRGRIEKGEKMPKILPYFERKEITSEERLKNKNLELAWVDPLEAFFLHIQGSGVVEFPDGKKLRLGYAAQNGAPYIAIGKYFTDVIPIEEMSMQRILAHLRSLSPEERQRYLNLNPSYVFFQPLTGAALTYMGSEVSSGRTIATDPLFYPKGALAFLSIELPIFADPKSAKESGWELKPRFVFDQDMGGAIRGGARADLFIGQGDSAGQVAGVMKRWGKLVYFAPKEEFVQELKSATVPSLAAPQPH